MSNLTLNEHSCHTPPPLLDRVADDELTMLTLTELNFVNDRLQETRIQHQQSQDIIQQSVLVSIHDFVVHVGGGECSHVQRHCLSHCPKHSQECTTCSIRMCV